MENGERLYRHSGRMGATSLPAMLFAGGAAALILGAIYGYLVFYCPFIYINFFITFFFGLGVGMAVGRMARVTHARNTLVVGSVGLLIGLFAEYVGWVSWVYAASEQELLLLSPLALATLASELAAEGVWSISSVTPTGGALWTVWAIEALVIIGVTTSMSTRGVAGEAFCERCERWVTDKDAFRRLAPSPDLDSLRNALLGFRYEVLDELALATAGANPTAEVHLDHCSGCDELHLLSYLVVHTEMDKNGEEKRSEDRVVKHLRVDGTVFERVQAALSAPVRSSHEDDELSRTG